MPVNNPINIFLINSNIAVNHVPFIKYLWISKIRQYLKTLQFLLIVFFFFKLLIVKSFEILPKHSA